MKVVCINFDNIDIHTGEITPAPKVGEICTVINAYEDEEGKWYELEEYPDYDYEQKNFTPLQEFKTMSYSKVIEREKEFIGAN